MPAPVTAQASHAKPGSMPGFAFSYPVDAAVECPPG
jgi:hypothetical protein